MIGLLWFVAALCVAQTAPKNPFASDARAAEEGRIAFRGSCSLCHGIRGEGGRGPDLTLGTYSAGETDPDLFRVISNGSPGTEMPAFSANFESEDIWRLVTYIRTLAGRGKVAVTGDREAGRQLYLNKGRCAQCHAIEGKGGRLGPDLTLVGRKRSLPYLKDSIVDPNADITIGFNTITVVTKDRKTIVGVQRGFDDFSAQLMDSAENFHSFEKSDVVSMKRELRSLMPTTYRNTFSEKELNDLVAYLSSLRGASVREEAGK
jgi:cytochrome c oxidase cbb3-type subunit III